MKPADSLNSKAKAAYKEAGVNEDAAKNLIKTIQRLTNNKSNIGPFAATFPLNLNTNSPLLVATCDGVGSKTRLAIEADFHQNIGIDLVAMCTNDLATTGATPLFFLDYFAVGMLKEQRDEEIIASILKGCQLANCTLLGGETAQLKDILNPNDYDLAGFAIGLIDEAKKIPKPSIKPGDAIIAIPSNGVHANGYSLIRKAIRDQDINIEKQLENSTELIIESLLKPTRIYNYEISKLVEDDSCHIKAVAHITGGGWRENLQRILPQNCTAEIDLAKFPTVPIFSWLAKILNFNSADMLDIFNCGLAMAIIIDSTSLAIVKKHIKDAILIGKITTSQQDPVIFKSKFDWI